MRRLLGFVLLVSIGACASHVRSTTHTLPVRIAGLSTVRAVTR